MLEIREAWNNEKYVITAKQGRERTELRCSNRHIHSFIPQFLKVHIIIYGRHSHTAIIVVLSVVVSIPGAVLICGGNLVHP